MNFGKVGFDPGHFDGQNIGPNGYIEGNAMLRLGLKLRDKYGCFITRSDGEDVSFQARTALAKQAKINTLISLHTDYPADGVMVIYSLKRPGDKVMAEYIGKEIAKAMGVSFRKVWTRPSTTNPGNDYYGMIRQPVAAGIDHVFIVEHGSHKEMSVNTEAKLNAIVEAYGRILGINNNDAYNKSIDALGKQYGIDAVYWKQRKNIDPNFENLIIKMANQKPSNFTYRTEWVTHVVEMDPMQLRAEFTNGIRSNRNNWVNANFFSGTKTIGWLISEGKVLSDRHEYKSWKGNYKGTFIVYKDGAVDVGLKLDSEIVAVLDKIWFCCQGFNLVPLDIKKEGFDPMEVGRKANRVGIGYNSTTGKVVIAVRPDTDAATMVTVMNNVGCHQSISLDSGGSTNLIVNGKDIFKTDRQLTNIIYWS